MNLLKLFENISPQQQSVGQLPADFKPKKISPVLDGPYGKMNATQGYLVGENLKEFAPVGGNDREPDEEEILKQLAAQWWNGTEQQMGKAQKTLAAMGWEIGQDESGDDDAGVFVIRAGDVNGDTYMAFPHSELELNEGVTEAGRYGSRNPDTMSPGNYDRYQQDQMDQGKRDFKRQEHEAEWEQEQAYSAKLAARDAGTWYIRLNGKIMKDKQGNPYSFQGKAAANKAALTMQAKLFNQGKEFMLTTNPNDKTQGMEEGWKEKLGAAAVTGAMALGSAGANARVTPDGQGGFTGGFKPTATATVTAPADNKPAAEAPKGFSKEYLQKAADPNRFGRYMISVEKAQELLKNMQEGMVEGDRTMSRAAKGYEKYGKQGMQALAKAGREGKDLDKVRDKYNKYDESVDQGMAEGVEDNPVASAITRRILIQRTDLLSKYGPVLVTQAIDEVADFVGDVEEIGSSDVSGWIKQVEQMLANNPPEAFGLKEHPTSHQDQYVKLFRESVAAGMTSEDVLSTLKRKLGDYLQDVATAVNRDNNLVGQLPNEIDQIGPAVKTITTDDGKEIKIHGNEDDGFRISINSNPMRSKFKDIRHAEMATEMYCAHRKSKSKDYVEEA